MPGMRLALPLTDVTVLGLAVVIAIGFSEHRVSAQSEDRVGARVLTARITEEIRVLQTYPFSEPNGVPILTSDARLYPYHSFTGYAHEPEPRAWKVIHLENDFIELWVLPEVGGKVWGARVKETGHEFIYRNEVLKFRNISLRGPWTSGGIEFNFGVIGHTPATATPVDYLTRENDDGSVSVFVGAMDLPSRTNWRVEVRLPADRAYFETNVLWQNPTPLEQAYYNWMTGAAFAKDDLVMSIPGNAYLEHAGAERAWPEDAEGRQLPRYDQNRFGGNKSFHVVGELNDFFGGYYEDEEYGFGHWARYEEMPGQKLWLWALSRQGGIWADLLTDADGQYIEFQAGRLLVQYSPGTDVNPISQVGFEPGATDRWSETWFPVEGLGGLTDASRDGAMFVRRDGDQVTVRVHAFRTLRDTLRVSVGGEAVAAIPVAFETLRPVSHSIDAPAGSMVVVELPRLGLDYYSDPTALALARPFSTEAEALPSIPEVVRKVMAARELVQGRYLEGARALFEEVVAEESWNRDALLGLADLEYRRGRFAQGLAHADRVLRLDAYDAAGNFTAGNLYRALGQTLDAREAFGWAARSMAFRSVSLVQLAELSLADDDVAEAERYGRLALDYDRYNLSAHEVIALVGRLRRDTALADSMHLQMLEIDPLHHFVNAERFLATRDRVWALALTDALRGEYPEQEILELAISYVRRGLADDAAAILRVGGEAFPSVLLSMWAAWLSDDVAALAGGVDTSFVFPYRPETIPVLEWAVENDAHWSWSYLLALNLWARDRVAEAAEWLVAAGDVPDHAAFYVVRAHVTSVAAIAGPDPEADLRRAIALDAEERTIHIPLILHLQDAGRWDDALAASSAARVRFPDDFNLDLLHVRSLNETMQFDASIDILDAIRVLPSEHAGTSQRLFAEAHTMAALDALERGDLDRAENDLTAAMTWPERLGLGRPYEPEERLQRYLWGVVMRADGRDRAAQSAFESVVAATPVSVVGGGVTQPGRLDLLAVPALVAMGRTGELRSFGTAATGAIGRIADAVRSAVATGTDVQAAIAAAGRDEMSLFQDVEGRLLYRALTVGAPPG